jgi:hypothetical protein
LNVATRRDATEGEQDRGQADGRTESWWRWVVVGIVLALTVIAVAEIPLFLAG